MYLAKNKDGYEFFFSSKDYCDTFKVVDKTFRNAKNELINKGYLREESKNRVNFSSSAAFKETKDNLQEKLKESEIPTMVYYPRCMHQQRVFEDLKMDCNFLF